VEVTRRSGWTRGQGPEAILASHSLKDEEVGILADCAWFFDDHMMTFDDGFGMIVQCVYHGFVDGFDDSVDDGLWFYDAFFIRFYHEPPPKKTAILNM